MEVNKIKKHVFYILSIFFDFMIFSALFYIYYPWFTIEGPLEHLKPESYLTPGNFICIVFFPMLVAIGLDIANYFLQVHNKDVHEIKPVHWLILAIIVTLNAIALWIFLSEPGYVGGFHFENIIWLLSFPVFGFELFCVWKGYSLSLKRKK